MNPIDFGVQSYCFRHFKDNSVIARKVRGIGLDKIELCNMHGDFSDPSTFAEICSIYRNEGVSIVSLGVQTFLGRDSEEAWFESAVVAGARHISAHLTIDSYLTSLPKLRKWSRKYGVRVGLHCHGGYMFGGSPDVLRHLIDLGAPEVGLCIDTAWAMQIGPYAGNPVTWAKNFAGQIYGVHVKDYVFEANGRWKDVIIGTGNLDLPAFISALCEGGFDGMAVIEYEGDAEAPDDALRRCVESMRSALG